MEVKFTEEEVSAFKTEYDQCVQKIEELKQELTRVTTRGIELQGLVRIIAEKEQESKA